MSRHRYGVYSTDGAFRGVLALGWKITPAVFRGGQTRVELPLPSGRVPVVLQIHEPEGRLKDFWLTCDDKRLCGLRDFSGRAS